MVFFQKTDSNPTDIPPREGGKHNNEKISYNYNSAPVRRADAVRLRGGRDEPPREGR